MKTPTSSVCIRLPNSSSAKAVRAGLSRLTLRELTRFLQKRPGYAAGLAEYFGDTTAVPKDGCGKCSVSHGLDLEFQPRERARPCKSADPAHVSACARTPA